MEPRLTKEERALLIDWLPEGSSSPPPCRGPHKLLAQFLGDPLTPQELVGLLGDVQRFADSLQGTPSLLLTRVWPEGRGESPGRYSEPARKALSRWERAWLDVDQLQSEGRLSVTAARQRLPLSTCLNALCVAVLCLDRLEDAGALVRAAAAMPDDEWLPDEWDDKSQAPHVRAWAIWLAGLGPLPPRAAEWGSPALNSALQGSWTEAAAALPAKLQKSFPKPIKRGPLETMKGQLLRQVISHAEEGSPPAKVLEESLRTFFSFWGRKGKDAWWDGMDVAERLPLVGLVAQITKRDPLALLHEQRLQNEHLTKPPARTFTPPAALLPALESLARLFEHARRAGSDMRVVIEVGGAFFLRRHSA